jgi:L-fuconate dehydratase
MFVLETLLMSLRIERVHTHDVRFPTSVSGAGSDAMNTDPDYSAAYVVLETNDAAGPFGHGLTFTLGRGNEICIAAIEALSHHVLGVPVDELTADLGGLSRRLVTDTQLRWLGPEKGVIHLATAALVNAVWDLYAKLEGKPLWKLLSDLSPDEIVACIDFRYIDDALSPAEAREILVRNAATRADRERFVIENGFPAYTTSAGWIGYAEETLPQRVHEALASGFTHLKLKVGGDPTADLRRTQIVREAMGWEHRLSLDANQAWNVGEAIGRIEELAQFDPWWIEEPTSPDDVLAHARIRREIAPIRVATGEHIQNRVIFKQLFQAGAIDVCQIDACRVGGVNEALSILLLAAKFDVPVCPHAGGVGLCEYVQHLAIYDYLCVGASLENRVIEWVDHLHEHFRDPAIVVDGRYQVPQAPGYSIEMLPETLLEYAFPTGPAWSSSGLLVR